MFHILADNLDQLDLAVDFLTKDGPNNARFALMLTDNVIEITLHQFALDKKRFLTAYSYSSKAYKYHYQLDAALGRSFKAKIKFACLSGLLTEQEMESLLILHHFRNEVHHIGVKHEVILRALAGFSSKLTCDFFTRYEPQSLFWLSDLTLPERVHKYFPDYGKATFPFTTEQFHNAHTTLSERANFKADELVSVLTEDMEIELETQDACLDIIAQDAPNLSSRDDVFMHIQSWLTFESKEGKQYLKTHNRDAADVFAQVEWLKNNYPWQQRTDPLPGWRKRLCSLRHERDPHKALNKYHNFMRETEDIRSALEQSSFSVDAENQRQLDAIRGK